MSSYVTYYLAWMLLAYAVRQPVLLVGIVVFLVFRRYIPDPAALLRAMRRASALKHQVAVNAANVTARRDLATIYLDLRRPKAALALIEQALARDPDDAELLFLAGRALQRAGRNEEALAPLVRAVELRPKLRYGEPYMVAGDALLGMGRCDEAIDAYERYARVNHSDVGVHVQLARAYARGSDRPAVRAALSKASETWAQIPWSLRRRAFGRWLEAQWLRARLLGDPRVVGPAAVIAGVLFFGVRFAANHAKSALGDSASLPSLIGAYMGDERMAVAVADRRCGSVSLADFQGAYEVEMDPRSTRIGRLSASAGPEAREAAAAADARAAEGFRAFRILPDRIRSGAGAVEEICFTRVIDRTPTSLHAEAVLRVDLSKPDDASLAEVRLERSGDVIRFTLYEPGESPDPWMTLRPTTTR